MASRPNPSPPQPPVGENETALEVVVQQAEAMATGALAGFERRALGYLDAGYPLHLRGPAGSGKTTLALRIAERLKRPIVLLVGDASFDTRRLIGGEDLKRTKRIVDRYISTVMKVESHTDAVAIFTSNPSDHVGTNLTLDALTDRMITLELDGFDRDTEIAIVIARSGLKPAEAGRIVDVVADFRVSRQYAQPPTLRASIMIARIAGAQKLPRGAAGSQPRQRQQACDDQMSTPATDTPGSGP